MKKLIKPLILVLGLIGAFCILMDILVLYELHATYDKELSTKETERTGFWKPLPDSSTDIYTAGDPSCNWRCVKFQYDKKDLDVLLKQVEEVNPNELDSIDFRCTEKVGLLLRFKKVKWWPENLNKDLFKLKDKQSDLKFYKYKEEVTFGLGSEGENTKTFYFYIIIDENSNTAYGWSPSS